MPAQSDASTVEIENERTRKVREIMDRVRTSPANPRFANFTGSYLFDVEGVGTWKVALERGKKTVTSFPSGPVGADEPAADCVIHCEPGVFVEVAEGERNLLTAFMQGRLEIEGDMSMAQKLNSIQPPPKQARGAAGGKGGAA